MKHVTSVEIFRAGTYRGETYSEEYLAQLADTFNPELYTPVVKLDHVEEGNACGKIVDVRVDEGKLLADLVLNDEAADLIKTGKRPNRSIEIWPPDSYQGEESFGGRAAIRGLALLGASPPQILGMEPVLLSDQDNFHRVTFFADGKSMEEEKSMEQQVERIMSVLSGIETRLAALEKILEREESEHEHEAEDRMETSENETLRQEEDTVVSHSDNNSSDAEILSLTGEVQRLRARCDATETQLKREREAREFADADARFERVFQQALSEGRVTPPERETSRLIFHECRKSGGVVEMSDANGKTRKLSASEAFLLNLQNRSQVVDVDPSRAAMKSAQDAHAESGRNGVELYNDTVRRIQSENPTWNFSEVCAEAKRELAERGVF